MSLPTDAARRLKALRRLPLAFAVALLAACNRESTPSTTAQAVPTITPTPAIVARIGERAISAAEFKAMVAKLPRGVDRFVRPGGARAELERVINALLAEDEGKRRGLDKDPAYLHRLDDVRQQAPWQEPELMYWVLRDRLTDEAQVTDEELHRYYEEAKGRFVTPQVHLRRIVVNDEAAARRARKRIDGGEDFAAVASAVDTDPVLRAAAGDMGVSLRDALPPSLRTPASVLKAPGDVSQPFAADGKWNILQLVSTELVPKPLESVRAQLETEIKHAKGNLALQRIMEAERAKLKVEIDDKVLAQLGPPAPAGSRPLILPALLRPPPKAKE